MGEKFRFTKERLDNLPIPDDGRETYTDTLEAALRLRVGKTGIKAFLCTRQFFINL